MQPGRCPIGCVLEPGTPRTGSCQSLQYEPGRMCWALGAKVCECAHAAWVAADRPVLPLEAGQPLRSEAPPPPTVQPHLLAPVFREAPVTIEGWEIHRPELSMDQMERMADLRERARHIAGNWKALTRQPWLLLLGETGTGKTLLLRILGRLALDAGLDVRYVLFSELIDDIKSTRSADSGRTEEAAMQAYIRPDLLIIDDVKPIAKGDPAKTEEIAHDVIKYRHGEDLGEPRRATWAAANLSVRELNNVIGAAALDRFLAGGAEPFFCTWPSYRRLPSLSTGDAP